VIRLRQSSYQGSFFVELGSNPNSNHKQLAFKSRKFYIDFPYINKPLKHTQHYAELIRKRKQNCFTFLVKVIKIYLLIMSYIELFALIPRYIVLTYNGVTTSCTYHHLVKIKYYLYFSNLLI